MYIFFTKDANMQYKNETPNITTIYIRGIGTSPIIEPSGVNGINKVTTLIKIVVAYTAIDACVSKNGLLLLLITCKPIIVETMP